MFLKIGPLVLTAMIGTSEAKADVVCDFSDQEFQFLTDKTSAKQFNEAKHFLLGRAKKDTNCSLNWLHLGHIYYLESDFRRASLAYQRVLKNGENKNAIKDFALLSLARAQRKQGLPSDALQTLNQISDSKKTKWLESEVLSEKLITKNENIKSVLDDFKNKKYDLAEEKLIPLLSTKQSPLLYSALAVSLYKQDKLERQRTALQYGREMERTPTEDEIFEQMESLLSRKYSKSNYGNWQSYLDLATGYDNNIYRVGKDSTLLGSQTIHLGLDFEKNFYTGISWQSFVRIGVSHDDYLSFQSEKYTSVYLVNKNVYTGSRWKLELSPQASYDASNDRPYLAKAGLYIDVYKELTDESGAGLSFDYFRNNPQTKIYDYLNGETQNYSAYFKYLLAENFLLFLAYNAFKNSSADDEVYNSYRVPLAYLGLGPAVSLIWNFTESWTAKLGLEQQNRTYNRNFLPEDKERKDVSSTAQFKLSYRFSETAIAFLQAQSILRTSTMTETSARNNNWSVSTWMTGLGWRLF